MPSFIDDVVSAMRQMGELAATVSIGHTKLTVVTQTDMSIEGIFRKNGNIRRLKELTEAIDRDASTVDLSTDNPVQLAALLKKFLRDLPDPLMTFKLHRLYIASQSTSLDLLSRSIILTNHLQVFPKKKTEDACFTWSRYYFPEHIETPWRSSLSF